MPPGWQILSSPTTKNLTRLFFLNTQQGWVAGRQGTLLKTLNGGQTWTVQNTGLSTDIVGLFMTDDQRGWALGLVPFIDTTTWYGSMILKTTNGGDIWTSTQYPVIGKFFSSIVFLNSLRGWISGANGNLSKTTDGGLSWIPVLADSTVFAHFSIERLKFFSPLRGLAVGGHFDLAGVVWRTTDAGEHWTTRGVSPEPVHDVTFLDSSNIIGVTGDFEYGVGLLRSEDGGQEWDHRYLGILALPTALSFRTYAEGWGALGVAGKFLCTLGTGRTWATRDTPEGRYIYDLSFVDSTTGYAIGDSGTILKYSSETAEADQTRELPLTPILRQSYPNPFNPSTTISCQLPTQSCVTLKVFDVLGREVATLVDGVEDPGYKSVRWNASGTAGGVYFARLTLTKQSGEVAYSRIIKLLLMR
jgi:photosystem II stability/assembly factor-like uncharacterized protein